MDSNTLGTRIKNLRIERNITQLKLAKYLNISNTTLSQYELGTRKPDYETLVKIAMYFNVTTDYLLGISDDAGKTSDLKNKEKTVYSFDLSGLPEHVVEQISDYLDFLRQKYHKKEEKDQKDNQKNED